MIDVNLLLKGLNAYLFCLSASAALIFADTAFRDRAHWRDPFYSAGVGFLVLFIGTALLRGWFLVWRVHGAQSQSWLDSPNISIILSSLVLVSIGTACVLRIFSYQRYGHWPWLLSLVLSTVFSIAICLT